MDALAIKKTAHPPHGLPDRFVHLREATEALVANLSPEDCQIQSMEDASPAKWHLAHTTWFWETFFLKPFSPGYAEFDQQFGYLFNSYYETVGPRHTRANRGMITRPGLNEIMAYRRYVTDAVAEFLESHSELSEHRQHVVETGIAHEEQHQELLLTDIKHTLSMNPVQPAMYDTPTGPPDLATEQDSWSAFEGGTANIGHEGDGFAYDNEGPRHTVWLEPYQISDRLVTNGDVIAFIEDGGYRTASLWLSEGWAGVSQAATTAPLYWEERDGTWSHFTLHGRVDVNRSAPAAHLTFFEADAIASWMDARLPTEFEWENAARRHGSTGAAMRAAGASCAPRPVSSGPLAGLFGEVWQWTRSDYAPYPRFQIADGAIGEYNGKFMSSQYVLRGSSCATAAGHSRPTYRNFFPPNAAWQFSGLRLARYV